MTTRPLVLLALVIPASAAADHLRIDVRWGSDDNPRLHVENLHLDVRCADVWLTPEEGLRVTVDGVEQRSIGVNGQTWQGVTTDADGSSYPISTWSPTDVGYALSDGLHHVVVAGPGCVPYEGDVLLGGLPRDLSGRLAIADRSLQGPTGAPDGFGLALGGVAQVRPAHPAMNTVFQTSFAFDGATREGGWISTSVERRRFVLAWDFAIAGTSLSGTATSRGGSTSTLTGTEVALGGSMRVGARIPMRDVALAAGVGLGADIVIQSGESSGAFTENPGPIDADWYIPIWSAITIKPWCDWGAQLVASYDVHPTATGESGPRVLAGLMWQRSAACSEPAQIELR